jgi:transcriptional regulator with XRE-family HTH domain
MSGREADQRPSKIARKGAPFRREARLLGKRIRFLRNRRGMTLEEAAEAMHMDAKHLQKIEIVISNQPINVTLVSLVRIAEGLRVPLVALFSDIV